MITIATKQDPALLAVLNRIAVAAESLNLFITGLRADLNQIEANLKRIADEIHPEAVGLDVSPGVPTDRT